MKKLLSLVLALIMATSVSVIGFAHENVDNTFDNFIPAPGVQAPDNWYDPFAYDEDGTIKKDALLGEGVTAIYCTKHKKIFSIYVYFDRHPPYSTLITDCFNGKEVEYPAEYCPYCGEIEILSNNIFEKTHEYITAPVYGTHCGHCGYFNAYHAAGLTNEYICFNCYKINTLENCYRFISEEHRTADYYFIFEESQNKYEGGQDCNLEDLRTTSVGSFHKWKNDPQKQPNAFVRFFRNIKNAFSSFFKRIANLFK